MSIDPAIDEGFATNVQGALNLLAAIDASGSRPHYVHVSTAYVAGVAQGGVPEGRLDHDIDWRVEQAAARLVRDRLEAAEQTAALLAESAVSVLNVALDEWLDQDGDEPALSEIMLDALASLRAVLAAPAPALPRSTRPGRRGIRGPSCPS